MPVYESEKKFRPKKAKGTVEALNKGRELDLRTKSGQYVAEIKDRLRDDLDETASALLEADCANAALLSRMYLTEAMAKPSLFKKNGATIRELDGYMKFANLQRQSLMALKRFRDNGPKPKADPKTLSDLLQVNDDSMDPVKTEDKENT